MPRWTERPLPAALVLLACAALVTLPNLGATSLWDDDEGRNAGCTREMIEADSWHIPTFNWDLRTAKPILLYWLMRPAFAVFGEGEFAARLPSAVCFAGVVLVVSALGRRMFDARTGFLAGLIACSSMGLVYLGRASITDAPLILFVCLYFWSLVRWQQSGWWWVGCGVASGLAVLTKGPAVGLILPAATVVLYLLWSRQWKQYVNWRALLGVLAFVLVAAPWYVYVSAETKGEWPRAFFLKDNVNRASEAMEGHSGLPVVYEFVVVCVMFAPWSGFLAASVWTGLRWNRERSDRVGESDPNPLSARAGHPSKLLLCWLGVFSLACAAAATKLPHYIAPVYPALALLTARLLARWSAGEVSLPKWVLPAGLIGFAVTGLAVIVGLLIGGGVIAVGGPQARTFPGLERWAWVGVFPLLSAIAGWWFVRKGNRPAVIASLVVGTFAFVGVLSAFAPQEVDNRKAVKPLVIASGARALDREARVGSTDFHQPSITFYTARRVERLNDPQAAADFLAFDIETYLLVPEPFWTTEVRPRMTKPWREAARHYDFYRNCDVLVITNR